MTFVRSLSLMIRRAHPATRPFSAPGIQKQTVRMLVLLCLFWCRLSSAEAAPAPDVDDNIRINADKMSQSVADGIYSAEGNVVVRQKDMTLTADRVRYTAPTHMLHATGSVVLTRGGAVLKGKTLDMDVDSGRAEMDSTLLTVPGSNMSVASDKLIRESESEYNATSSNLTTCDLPDPSWKFNSEKLHIDTDGYATGRNVIFYVKNIPVLYIPWIAFPVVLEKSSGLLLPRMSKSTRRGFQLDIPLYLVISPSQDLLLDLDLMSKRGVGTGVEYRYIRVRGSEGHINGYQIYDQVQDRWRGQLAQTHKEIFSPDANLRMTVNATSDRTFFKDFGEKSGEYNRQSTDSTFNALQTWQHYAVTSYLRYSDDLYAVNNRTTLQTLPSLGIAAVRQPLFSLPLYFDLDGAAENLYREAAPSGQRLHLFPTVTLLPFTRGALSVSLFAGAHVRGYVTNKREGSGTPAHTGDLLPEAGARVSLPLARIYDADFQHLKKIRHEIIPELRYSFMPEDNQQRLPLYDYTDRMIHLNMVSLSATSVLSGKFISGDTTEYRDISRIKLEARYSISGQQRDLLTLVESRRPWSDLILESETWLNKQVKVTFDGRYNLYEDHLSTAAVGIEADDKMGNTVGAAYQMARNVVEYFEGRISTKLIKPLQLSYLARYSFDRNDFLESVYSAEYRHKCWSVNLAVHQRPGDWTYSVNFNLAGLGSK